MMKLHIEAKVINIRELMIVSKIVKEQRNVKGDKIEGVCEEQPYFVGTITSCTRDAQGVR